MYTIGRYTLFFLIYSFVGSLIETLYRLITEGQLYGIHGFLHHLPILPIYGFGALIVILLARKVRHPFLLFVLSALAASVLEFVTSWGIEMVLGTRIWDYSNDPLNLFGRVDLFSSIGFGLVALLLVYYIHPLVSKLIKHLTQRTTIVIASVVWVVLLTDTVISFVQRLKH